MFTQKIETLKKIASISKPDKEFSAKGYSSDFLTTELIRSLKGIRYLKEVPEIFIEDFDNVEALKAIIQCATGRHSYYNEEKGYILDVITPDYALLNDIFDYINKKLDISVPYANPSYFDEYEKFCKETAERLAASYEAYKNITTTDTFSL